MQFQRIRNVVERLPRRHEARVPHPALHKSKKEMRSPDTEGPRPACSHRHQDAGLSWPQNVVMEACGATSGDLQTGVDHAELFQNSEAQRAGVLLEVKWQSQDRIPGMEKTR
ncbi:uncharacterized protein LOC120891335 [Ictidomys tridecemlineatus]